MRQPKKANGLALGSILDSVTSEILASQERIKKTGRGGIFYIDKADVMVSFVVKRGTGGAMKLLAVEADGNYSTEQVHQVTLHLTTSPPHLEAVLSKISSRDQVEAFLEGFRQQAGE